MNEDQIKAYELGRLINTFGVWYKTNLFKSINDLNNFAKTLLENTDGNIDEAVKLIMKTNKNYMKHYNENDGVGDYWDYWTNNLPEIYDARRPK